MTSLGSSEMTRRFFVVFALLVLENGFSVVSTQSICRVNRSHLTSRYVSYQEVYTTRKFIFKKLATRINYRWEYYREWTPQNECCPGYEPQGIQTSICRPTCPSGCHYGKCIEPNVCSCDLGYRAVEIDGISRCMPHCAGNGADGCGDNGSCIAPNICACHVGYSLTISIIQGHITSGLPCIPKCNSPECGTNSYCASPEYCACKNGYTRNETEISRQPTSTFTCVPSCVPGCGQHSKCLFPEKCICDVGYSASSIDGSSHDGGCLPICEPVCSHGTCISPGHCQCHQGYAMSSSRLNLCSPICDPLCVNGVCTAPGECQCHPGYRVETESSLLPLCVPVCEPRCDIGSFCSAPNECRCADGYVQRATGVSNETIICTAVCEPNCGQNESCVAPGVCQCQPGYRRELAHGNITRCRPICQQSCGVNAYCDAPNRCICFFGYQADPLRDLFACEPICQNDCYNGTCTLPNYCQCYEGYEKQSQQQLSEVPRSYENTCVPICREQCLMGTCVAPDLCMCDPGYVLVNVTSLVSTSTTDYTENGNTTTVNETQTCQPFCETPCPIGSECLSPGQCGPPLDYGSYEFPINSTDRVDRVEDCGRNTDYLNAENGKCVCKYGWTGRLCQQSLLCALLIAFNSENEKSTTLRSIFMDNDTIEPNYYDDDRVRMISRDDDDSVTIDWDGPMCAEDCRVLMTSSGTAQNRSDEAVTCYLSESENVMTGVLSIRERASLTGSTNGTLACFIDIGSPCNLAEFQLVRETYESLVGGIIGVLVIIVLVAVGSAVYYRKKRTAFTPAVSMSNSTLLIRAESMYSLHTTEDSSSLHALRQHMLRHAGKSHKCGLPGCPTVLRTANELKSHRLLVHESSGTADQEFQCDECSYAAKTRIQLRRHNRKHKVDNDEENPRRLTCPYSSCSFITKVNSHLTRHIRLHTGTKPYKCRHCKYASNNLENLRKHVLSTSLHPGKTIYECDACRATGSTDPYRTNFAKELRAHLLETHPREFPGPSHASDHVAGIFGIKPERTSPIP